MDLSGDLIVVASTVTIYLKVLIDGVKLGTDGRLPGWSVPLLALVLSPLLCATMLIYTGAWTTTPEGWARLVLLSILAFGMATGVTELGKRATVVSQRADERGKSG